MVTTCCVHVTDFSWSTRDPETNSQRTWQWMVGIRVFSFLGPGLFFFWSSLFMFFFPGKTWLHHWKLTWNPWKIYTHLYFYVPDKQQQWNMARPKKCPCTQKNQTPPKRLKPLFPDPSAHHGSPLVAGCLMVLGSSHRKSPRAYDGRFQVLQWNRRCTGKAEPGGEPMDGLKDGMFKRIWDF